jgi:uncharacterized protein (TIGR03663 family)
MKWMPTAFLLILVLAAGLRMPRLAERPMHHDEANQAYRFGILLETGRYAYDAEDHHGPTLYYLTLPVAWLSGAQTFADTTERMYRLVPVVFGLLLVLSTPLLRNGIGCVAVLCAALLTAVSPAMAYYSRFYIQETVLVFFTFLAIASGMHALRRGSIRWAVICGISAGLMFATKETAVLSFAAAAGAGVLCACWSRQGRVPWKLALPALGCALAVWLVFFSSFFTHWSGPLDSILAFKGYFERGAGVNTDHVHPWYFYLKILLRYRLDGGPVWSESLIVLLGLAGCVLILLKKIPPACGLGPARFLMVYTLLLTIIYSAIAYKTPWCVLSFLHGWILLAGIAVAAALEALRSRIRLTAAVALLLVTASAGLAFSAQQAIFRYAADYRNPYVYAHTSPEFMDLVERVESMAGVSPQGRNLYIQVIAPPSSTWPLPFYLRRYPNVGFWTDAATAPESPRPPIVISTPDVSVDPAAYVSEFHALRMNELLVLHVETGLWERFMAAERIPQAEGVQAK